jgi:hypothetical protein
VPARPATLTPPLACLLHSISRFPSWRGPSWFDGTALRLNHHRCPAYARTLGRYQLGASERSRVDRWISVPTNRRRHGHSRLSFQHGDLPQAYLPHIMVRHYKLNLDAPHCNLIASARTRQSGLGSRGQASLTPHGATRRSVVELVSSPIPCGHHHGKRVRLRERRALWECLSSCSWGCETGLAFPCPRSWPVRPAVKMSGRAGAEWGGSSKWLRHAHSRDPNASTVFEGSRPYC